MNEWTVVIALVTLCGLAATVGKPVIDLTKQLTKLNVHVETIEKENAKADKENKEEHKVLFVAQREDEKKILENTIGREDHEKRITNLEAERKIKANLESGV